MSAALTLFVPSLCAAWRGEGADMPAAHTPILRRLLARADRVSLPLQELSQSSFEDGLARLFGLGAADMPWGALGAWGESGERSCGFVMRLDPVHFKLGMTEAIVLGGAALHLSMDEANTLARALEQHFSEQGWRIVVAAPLCWYLYLPQAVDVLSVPLAQALGRDAGLFKPQGKDAGRWLADMTEAQMVLFAHPLNQAREARGLPSINSVWPWGAGALSANSVLSSHFARVYANQPLARGLALAQGVPVHDLPETLEECAGLHGNTLIVLDDLVQPYLDGDFDDWQATLEGLEARWFVPLWTALAQGRVRELNLDTGAARFEFKSAYRWRLWRRERALEQQCVASV